MRAIFPYFVVAVLALLCRGAAAQSIQYVAKERRVRAFHYEVLNDGDTQTIIRATKEVVAGFGDFDAVARAQAVPEFEGAYAEVSQRSAFRGGITASGRIRGQTWTLWGGYDWESVVGATFDVVGGPVRYELEYAIEQMETGEGFRFNDFTLITVSPEPLTVFDFDIPDPADGDDPNGAPSPASCPRAATRLPTATSPFGKTSARTWTTSGRFG